MKKRSECNKNQSPVKLDEFSREAVKNLSPENIRKKVERDMALLRKCNLVAPK